MKILLIEDDVKLAGLVQRGLASAGHVVDAEHDGEAGENALESGGYELIVLDLMLPKKDGLAVLRGLGADHTKVMWRKYNAGYEYLRSNATARTRSA